MNPMILVEMIQCSKSGTLHNPSPEPIIYEIGEPYAFSKCTHCLEPIFSDLMVREHFMANPENPMGKFCDPDGHLWATNQPTYMIEEEPV